MFRPGEVFTTNVKSDKMGVAPYNDVASVKHINPPVQRTVKFWCGGNKVIDTNGEPWQVSRTQYGIVAIS